MSAPDRGALLDPEHGQLSIRRQCALLGVRVRQFIGHRGRRTRMIWR